MRERGGYVVGLRVKRQPIGLIHSVRQPWDTTGLLATTEYVYLTRENPRRDWLSLRRPRGQGRPRKRFVRQWMRPLWRRR